MLEDDDDELLDEVDVPPQVIQVVPVQVSARLVVVLKIENPAFNFPLLKAFLWSVVLTGKIIGKVAPSTVLPDWE